MDKPSEADKMVGKLVMLKCDHDVYNWNTFGRLSWEKLGTQLLCVGNDRGMLTVVVGEQQGRVPVKAVVCPINREFLAEYKICLTGTGKYRKDSLRAIIEVLGGEVAASPKKATHFVQGHIDESLKLTYAKEHSIPVLSQEEFRELIKGAVIGIV